MCRAGSYKAVLNCFYQHSCSECNEDKVITLAECLTHGYLNAHTFSNRSLKIRPAMSDILKFTNTH